MIHRLLLVALALSLVPHAVVRAHPGHDHRIMGTVAAIDGARITMTTVDGTEVSFAIDEETKFLRGREDGAASDLKAGMRIVVNVGEGEEPLVAKEIRYAPGSTAD